MTHTQVCENASTPDCFCECKGKLHGRNPKSGVAEKEGYAGNPDSTRAEEMKEDEKEIEKAWNNANFSTRLFTLGPVTGTIKDRDEADFASRSSWDELSPATRNKLLGHGELTKQGLKGTTGKRGKSESSFQRMVRQDKERSREQKMERRAGETYVVVHHEREDGGYVVRTADDGILPSPYRDSKRYAEYKNKPSAQKKADMLNEEM